MRHVILCPSRLKPLLRKFLPSLLALLLVAAMPAHAVDTQYLQGIGDARYHRVASAQVGRAYHVFVALPDGYDENEDARYPTVYVLDGGALFPLLSAYYRYLNFGEEIPDAIIVGISYGGDTFEEGNFRGTDYTAPSAERDYWGGAEDFQSFLSDELFTLIEDEYRSNPDRRIVYGQSIGGQFVLFTALTKPDLFWGHIASNPALHRNLPFFLEPHWRTVEGGRSRLFVASGTLDEREFRGPAVEWMRHWNSRPDRPWTLQTTDLDGHSHMSAPPASFRRGMRWLFSGD